MTALAWSAKVSDAFIAKFVAMCARLEIDEPSNLMACIAFETGQTFSPAKRNTQSAAVGLIQFMPSTARQLGTTADMLAGMSDLEQLVYVEKYLVPYAGRMRTLADTYMAILWPAAVDLPADNVVFRSGSKAFLQNSGLDINHDGDVTKAECAAFVQRQLEIGLRPENVREYNATEPVQVDPVEVAPQPEGEAMGIAIPILSALLPQILELFSGRAQAAITKATKDPAASEQFMQSLIAEVGKAVNIPVVDATTATQAVAAVTANPTPAIVKQLEDHSLDFIDKMGPIFDRLAAADAAENAALLASQDAAAARADAKDLRPLLARNVWIGVGAIALALAVSIVAQVFLMDDHKPESDLVVLFGSMVTYMLARLGDVYGYAFGGVQSSRAGAALQSAADTAIKRSQV